MEKTCEKYTLELDEYIAKTKSRLDAILSALNWNEVDTLKKSTCSGHLKLKKQKDDSCDPLLPESFNSMHSIVVDDEQLKQILHTNQVNVPKKFSDIQINFTREQKLAIYDYVILNTGKISEPELKVSMSSEKQGANDMTFAEIVAKAKKKDKKLKRKYRTSKPTHIEEVRNLVHLQMQALAQYFEPKSSKTERSSPAKCSDERRLQNPRSRSRSLSRDKRRSKNDREWSRKRHRSYSSENSKKRRLSHSQSRLDSHRRSRSKKKSKKRSKSPHKIHHKSSKSKKTKHHKSKTNVD